ncbi:MAG: HAMP domain-containing histidine kinase [Desulfobacula sp.]|nr:HAMP domain-containing histidine kinase [Desulfobacula sp.]
MSHDWKETAKKGFRFSGEITASATHEIKNSLAVIKENAGLLEDLARMADKDRPLLPEKMIVLGQRITKHVDQANKIVMNINRLSHSTDKFETSVNVVEIIDFLKTITKRLINNRGAVLHLSSTGKEPVLTTSPFLLKQLVWQCICLLMEEMRDSKEVQINIAGHDKSVILFFKGVSLSKEAFDLFVSKEANALRSPINFDITRDENTGELVLVIRNSSF